MQLLNHVFAVTFFNDVVAVTNCFVVLTVVTPRVLRFHGLLRFLPLLVIDYVVILIYFIVIIFYVNVNNIIVIVVSGTPLVALAAPVVTLDVMLRSTVKSLW